MMINDDRVKVVRGEKGMVCRFTEAEEEMMNWKTKNIYATGENLETAKRRALNQMIEILDENVDLHMNPNWRPSSLSEEYVETWFGVPPLRAHYTNLRISDRRLWQDRACKAASDDSNDILPRSSFDNDAEYHWNQIRYRLDNNREQDKVNDAVARHSGLTSTHLGAVGSESHKISRKYATM
jgi:metal-sulfur cluster biosynthetic enzyme